MTTELAKTIQQQLQRTYPGSHDGSEGRWLETLAEQVDLYVGLPDILALCYRIMTEYTNDCSGVISRQTAEKASAIIMRITGTCPPRT